MRVDTGRISVDVPDGFEDVTSYVFEGRPDAPKKHGPPDRLSVSFEPMPEHVAPEGMIAHLRRALERSAGAGASLVEGTATAGKLPVATLSLSLAGSPGGMFLAAFRWPGALVGKVQYESSREDASVVFKHVVGSVRPIGVRATPPPGFVRRRAGPLWLLMPDTLAPLSSYAFSADGGCARLLLDRTSDPPGEPPLFHAWIDHGALDLLEVEPLNEGSCAADRRPIEERSWCVDRLSAEGDPLGSTWFRVAWVPLPEGGAARVWMIERGSPRIGETCWEDIVASVQLLPEGP